MKRRAMSSVILAAVLAGGCASSQMSRIDRNRDIYETWPLEVRQAVLDGKVEPGMTPDMVRVAWGQPSEVTYGSNVANDEEIWIYRKGGDDGSIMPVGGSNVGMGGNIGGIGITRGSGGTSIGATGGVGLGGSSVMGGSTPVIVTPPTPPEIREVVFRGGVVYRADAP